MPQMDGYEASLQIRKTLTEQKIAQPIITAVTGHTEASFVKRCYDSGMNQVFSKPVSSDLIIDLLKKLNYIQ